MDEVAELAGKDPIEFRLELFERAKNKPVGKDNDYDADRYAGVLKLVKEKSNWNGANNSVHRGVAAYFCHNTYVAEVIDMTMKENKPVIEKVYAAVDCGVVINPDAAANMGEGAIVDGIGNALYGEMTFQDGVPQKNNFDTYRMIRHSEAPKSIEVHFVKNEKDPTGLGEPLFPPIFGALANALHKATGKRFYEQPFGKQLQSTTPYTIVSHCLLLSRKNKSIMKKMLLIVAIAGVFTSCGNGSESSSSSDTTTSSDTTKSITPPPTSDTASATAPMMGDTSKTDADSLKK